MDAFVKKTLGLHVPAAPTASPLLSNPEGDSDESDATPVQESQNAQLENLVSLRNRARRRMSQSDNPNFPSGQIPTTEVISMKSPKLYVASGPETTTNLMSKKKPLGAGIIRVTHPFRIKWDLFVMGLAVWNVFCIPYTLVFNQDFGEKVQVVVINLSIDFIFAVDIVLTFRTSFYSAYTGDEILELSLIARNYLVGKFWIDAVTCIPNDLVDLFYTKQSYEVSTRNLIALIGILKLYRISRLNRIINFMRAKSDIKLATRIMQLILFLVMYLHLLCCGWWIVTRYDESWVPSSGEENLYIRSADYIYWTNFYAAVQMLVGGEISPRTTLQASFSAIMIFCGAFINAVMFGSMAVLMSNLNMRQTKFQETQNLVNTAMKNMRLPDPLQQRISDYLIYTQATMASSEEFETFRSLISPSLYNEVLQCIYGQLIKDNDVVMSSDSVRNFILPKLKPKFCKPEEVLIHQNEEGRALYFVARGTCQVLVADEMRRERQVSLLKPGLHFGEIALLTHGVRTATVRSMNYCTLAMLDRDDFAQMLTLWPGCRTVLKRTMFQYQDKYKRFLLRMLRRVAVFKGLKVRTEQELLYSMRIENVEEGEYLVKPGQMNDRIWFLAEGEIEVSVTLSDKDLNWLRIETYQIPNSSKIHHKVDWHQTIAAADCYIKKFTEIYPVWGPVGIVNGLHSTEVENYDKRRLLGKNCVELELELLRMGSVLGSFSLLTNETFSIQARALTKCTCYVLDKTTIYRLRKACGDLHESLLAFEMWSRIYTPYVDDYHVANDGDRSFQVEFNLHRGRNRFKGAVLRVIKDNRDRRVLDTPMIAVMLKDIKASSLSRKVSALRFRADSHFTDKLLKETFSPNIIKKISMKNTNMANDVEKLLVTFSEQNKMIENLREQVLLLNQSIKSAPRLADDKEPEDPYQTIVHRPKKQ